MKDFIVKTISGEMTVKAYHVGNLRVHRPIGKGFCKWRISTISGIGLLGSNKSLKETLVQTKIIDSKFNFSLSNDELRTNEGLRDYILSLKRFI